MSALAVAVFSNVTNRSENSVANEIQERLNQALTKYNHSIHEIELQPEEGTEDEIAVLRSLQWKDLTVPGSPFMRPDWDPETGNASDTYRLIWNGRVFKLARPGTAGDGLIINFDAEDTGKPVEFPEDFSPL